MPANIESFASAREVAWHKLGTVVDHAMTAEEAAKLASLDNWNVRLAPLYARLGNFDNVLVPERNAVVRDNPNGLGVDALGVVGDRYKIIQNEEAFAVLDGIVDEGGARYETAGSLNGGRRVFMSMRMPDGIQVAGEDAHDVYLLATNSHDGSSAFTVAVTPVRVVCQNTLTMGLRQAKQQWNLRHTSSVQGRIQEARESLRLTYKYMETFEAELENLLTQEMTNREFSRMVNELIPVKDSSSTGWQMRASDQQETLRRLFVNAETNEFGRGTKYAAYNAITEYADWYMPVKGVDPLGHKRAERTMTAANVQAFKNKGLALLSA